MKKAYLLLLFLFAQLAFAQFEAEKVEVYQAGTKVIYYMGQCGETIPGTEGKLTYCDSKGNLGVIEKNFGLNSNYVMGIAENHYNDDEVFITRTGISIKRANGEWQSIPNYMLKRSESFTQFTDVTEAVVDNNGNLYYNRAPGGKLNSINIETLQKSTVDIDLDTYDFHPMLFAINPENNNLYFIASYSNDRKLLVKDAYGAMAILPFVNMNYQVGLYKMEVRNNILYMITSIGFYKYNLVTGTYNQFFTGDDLLPVNALRDFVFEDDDTVWIAASNNNTGSLYRWNLTDNTYEEYTFPNPNGNVPLRFDHIAKDVNGKIWANAQNYGGLVTIEPETGDTEYLPNVTFNNAASFFGSMGFPIHNPNRVQWNKDKLYVFAHSSYTTETHDKYHILHFDGTSWVGYSNNAPENNGSTFSKRFRSAFPSDNGVWWGNNYDDTFAYIGNDDEFKVLYNQTMNSNARRLVVDTDDYPVFLSGSNPSGPKKIIYPETFTMNSEPNQQSSDIVKYKDQIWVWSNNNKKIRAYKNNQLIAVYDLNGLLTGNFYEFGADASGNAWFANYDQNTNEVKLHQYNISLGTMETHIHATANPFYLSQITSLPNGGIAVLFTRSIIYFNNGTFQEFSISDNILFQEMVDAVADTDGNLYILYYDTARILKMSDFPQNSTPEVIRLDAGPGGGSSAGSPAIVPDISMYRPNTLVLDYQGRFWAHASGNFMKITLSDTPYPYFTGGETYGVRGKVYLDTNNNNQFDEGEEFVNQRVALAINGEEKMVTYTNTDGEYYFSYYQLNVPYDIVLPALSPNTYTTERVKTITPSDDTGHTFVEDFRLEPIVVDGLFVQTANKDGAYAFVRNGFENTFTTAIGNISQTRTYNNIELSYLIKNEDENSDNVLPDIEEVKVYKVIPNGNRALIFDIQINPRSHKWHFPANLVNSYTSNLVTNNAVIEHNSGEITVDLILPQILPLEVYVIEIATNLFDPTSNRTVLTYGFKSVKGNDLGGDEFSPQARDFILIPRQDNIDLGIPTDINPYIYPEDIDYPYIDPKDIYTPLPQSTSILSSYDPNDKLVSPGLPDEINEQEITNKWLQYTIRFENEGNYSAKDVSIIDEFDNKLNLNTFTLMGSSHPVKINQLTIEDKTFMKFDFEDIYLDYTANDPHNSQGWISFYIKANEDVQIGDMITNNASIYFDQNPAIITNTTQNVFVEATLNINQVDIVSKNKIFLYPNPTNNILNLSSQDNISNVVIVDILGKTVYQNNYNQNEVSIDVSDLQKAMYFAKITTESHTQTVKFIKK